ncbi:hypothetical protein RJ639_008533 [Escallonia herrerae]|uniref:Uncharacterized protein n=1 Tax=Escallonia herrerae TaxID=1293975 RepID=A0AA88VRD0_9ASTE|nr:hypothetical protein RJ639_008533 [Escallonia herrerae]
MEEQAVAVDRESLQKRPGIFILGCPNVGKRTLLSRLLSLDFEDASDSSSDVLAYGWTINTKYYMADVSLWMANLSDEFSIRPLPMFDQLAALVMVFNTTDLSSFLALKDWVSRTDIQKFDILLCIGNKVDLLPDHPAHVEYKRRLQKLGESWSDPHPEFSEYGINETEGSSLLGDEEPSMEIKSSCVEWCCEHNIEYIEACASNADFDKYIFGEVELDDMAVPNANGSAEIETILVNDCGVVEALAGLSVDGDSQGVERLLEALSANMWPGMVLKSGDKIVEPSLPEKQDLSEEESDYEIEYEMLSVGSAEPWDDTDGGWVTANGTTASTETGGLVAQNRDAKDSDGERVTRSVGEELPPSTSTSQLQEEIDAEAIPSAEEADGGTHYEFEDLEQLMSEIGNMRDSLRLMPDFQRREMAANLAMKMASMFGDSSGDEGGVD